MINHRSAETQVKKGTRATLFVHSAWTPFMQEASRDAFHEKRG